MADSRIPGLLVMVGPTEEFFPDFLVDRVSPWIVDQLTLGSAPVEVWRARKSPFRKDTVKLSLVEKF